MPSPTGGCEAHAATASAFAVQALQTNEGRPLMAVAYLRTARDEVSVALETQREALVKWAAERHVSIVQEFIDVGVSAHTAPGSRAGVKAMLAYCKRNHVEAVVCTCPTRLARDPLVYTTWMERLARRNLVVEFVSGPQRPDGASPLLWAGMLQMLLTMFDCNSRGRSRVGKPSRRVKTAVTAQHLDGASGTGLAESQAVKGQN